MPPRIPLLSTRLIEYRTRPIVPQKRAALRLQQRFGSDDATKAPGTKGPNMENAPHVSEEQAAMDKTMGETPPDIEGQGTPVQEILERDGGKEKAPQAIKEDMATPGSSKNSKPPGSRSFSTSARRENTDTEVSPRGAGVMPFDLQYPDSGFGHKFALPDITTMSRHDNLKKRYDHVVDQLTKSLMRHGKLAKAQNEMAHILNTLRTAPAPQTNLAMPDRKILIPERTPREALPLSPVQYLTAAIDGIAPLIKIRQQRGMLGGGAMQPIPQPLSVRQRRRQSIQWILDASEKRRDVKLADRVAKEIIAVAEGKSGVWDRRALLHRMATSARSNVKLGTTRRMQMGNRKGL